MIKNPFLNAVAAAVYIVAIVLGINLFAKPGVEDTILIPMVMLSLLVLSVAIMAVHFFYEPARLFLENKRPEALTFFFKTTGSFAVFAIILVATLLYTSIL